MTNRDTARASLLQRLLVQGTDENAEAGIPHLSPGTAVPLSAAQAGIWFFSQYYPTSAEYNLVETLQFERHVSREALGASVGELMRRHDALRLRIEQRDGEPVQLDGGTLVPPIEAHDLTGMTAEQARAWGDAVGSEAVRRPLPVDRPPLFRVVHLALPGDRTLVLLVFHHVIADHWSLQQLHSELDQLLTGRPLPPSPSPAFLDYVAWQAGRSDPAREQRELAYWRRTLGGDLPVLALPHDRPRPATPSRSGHVVPLRVEGEVIQQIRSLASAESTTPFTVLLAAYVALLNRLTGQDDLIVGTALAGRDGPASEHIVGCFVRPVALRTDAGGAPDFRTLVHRVHERVVDAHDHQTVPFERIVADLGIPRAEGVSPVFQTYFGLQKDTTVQVAGGQRGGWDLDTEAAKWDLTVSLTEEGDGISGMMEYAADLFEHATVARFADMYEHLLADLVARPEACVLDHPLVVDSERIRILEQLNPYRRPRTGHRSMTGPFEEQVRRTPEATALVWGSERWSYAELNSRANRLARHLQGLGVTPCSRVAVCMERSADLVAVLYAVCKLGATYVPLDPEHPDARLAFVLSDTDPSAVVVDSGNAGRLAVDGIPVVVVPGVGDWADLPDDDLPCRTPEGALLHLLYTSGSTGLPKGVAYPVEGALANLAWLQAKYPFGPGDAAVFKTSFGFDVSIWEIFWPLYHGATLVVARPGGHRDPRHLVELIERHSITTVFLIPTLMQVFLEQVPPGSCPSLRWVFCGGEPVTARIRDTFQERFDAALINCYGPTEAGAVTDMVLPVEPGAVVPLGRPADNFRLYVLDERQELVPVGVVGEACIGGEVGVGYGYHRRPDLTAERFLPDPYGPPGSRMYRTGDLCRYRADGVLEHLGRIGRQVKIRGLRVEPGEIESVLDRHPGVESCAVLAVGAPPELVAFVVARPGRQLDRDDLARRCRVVLPAHMVPARFVEVPSLPANVNGKLDERALTALLAALPSVMSSGLASGSTTRDGASANPLEAGLASAFARVLGLEQVGVTDNFFDLGGHSLLVFKLISLCARDLQLELTVNDVFAAPSARRLAQRTGSSATRQEALVPLRPNPGRPLLVVVHAASGTVLPFLDLARALGDDFDAHGIQAADDPSSPLAASVTRAAAHYVGLVDAVRDMRPLVVAGWSVGGCIAVEMARAWAARGCPVAGTVLLDTWAPPGLLASRADAMAARRRILELDMLGLEGVASGPAAVTGEERERLRALMSRHREAFLDYLPARFDGRIDLLAARDSLSGAGLERMPAGYADGDRRWGTVAAEVDVHEVPGSHFSLLGEQHVAELARVVRSVVSARLAFEGI